MIDFDLFLRTVVDVRNEGGGRGYDQGLRTFNCPLCDDTRERGWLGVRGEGAGCFNIGCVAEPSLKGGAVEWARRVLKLTSRGEAYRILTQKFGGGAVAPLPITSRGDDFCDLPDGYTGFARSEGRAVQDVFTTFAKRQWGIGIEDAVRWTLGYALRGPYAFRIIIPIFMHQRMVGFQARAIRAGAEPKYRTSSNVLQDGRPAECGRPAAAMLFNYDAIKPGRECILVEGPGDVMGWHATHASPPAVGLLGVAFTEAKLALLKKADPSRVVVALDNEPEAQKRAAVYLRDLAAWGIPGDLGGWQGGKDAGSGAELVLRSAS